MFEAYRRACESGQVQPGRMHVFERDEMSPPRFIINFPMKNHWRSPSRLEDIESGLQTLVDEVRRLNIRTLALRLSAVAMAG